MRKLLIIPIWLLAAFSTLSIALFLQKYRADFLIHAKIEETLTVIQNSQKKASYQLYASMPDKVLGTNTFTKSSVKSKNPVPEIVEKYLKKHKSPMADYSDKLIAATQQYNLDPLLLVAIAQCESNLGKKMPSSDCYNPFGWGIHSRGTLCFASWEEGFEKVAKGLAEKYFAKGYQSPEKIMKKYTPLSLEKNGSWAKCVNQSLSQLETLE